MTGNNTIMLDACFVAAFVGISGVEVPLRYKDIVFKANEIIAPSIIDYEIGNTIWKIYKRKETDTDAWFNVYENMIINKQKPDAKKTFSIAKKYNLSFYDASYVALLKEYPDVDTFLTFDSDFKKVADKRITVLKV